MAEDIKDIDISDHSISVRLSTQVSDICHPLFRHTKINYFHYIRYYKEGFTTQFVTNKNWHQYVLKNQLYPYFSELNPGISLLKESYNERHQTRSNMALNHFNLCSFFEITKPIYNKITKKIEYFEVFGFASSSNNTNYYLNNLEILKKFLLYFKEKSRELIKLHANNRIILTTPNFLDKTNICKPQNSYQFPKKLTESLVLDKYHFNHNNQLINITHKQLECMKLLSHGKNVKEIGVILNISPRTVETHLNHVKEKLHYYNKQQLINFYEKNFSQMWIP